MQRLSSYQDCRGGRDHDDNDYNGDLDDRDDDNGVMTIQDEGDDGNDTWQVGTIPMTLALAGWNNPQQHRAPEQQAGRSSGGETGPACDQAQAGAGTEVNKLGKEVLKVGETE